jgi:hypothetical protein
LVQVMPSIHISIDGISQPTEDDIMTALLRCLVVFLVMATARAADPQPTVATTSASPVGNKALTVNGRVHPHGAYVTYWFEYGPTAEYGARTPPRSLPPRLAAFYHESWDDNAGGWSGGLNAKDLVHHTNGGAAGGFVRFTEPSGHDPNHVNGVGTVHLSKYVYPGHWAKFVAQPSLQLAAGDPDFRDAKISIQVRGVNWVPNGSELQWWSQSQSNIALLNKPGWSMANWSYTGFGLNPYLASGKWEKVEYRLTNDTANWSYAGNNKSQSAPERYSYWPIDQTQEHLNADFFHMVTFVDTAKPPTGAIDFDELTITYRNYSLLVPSNGGKLLSSPKSPDSGATLTDGWRFGPGKTWASDPEPTAPLEFVYQLQQPITIKIVQLHQNPEWPTKDVEVMTSTDGESYTSLCKSTLPEKGVPNANFAYALTSALSAKATHVKVRILSGYKKERWGLGEIEVFGSGARMLPDDDLYHVNTDLVDLKPGTTYHYRLVVEGANGVSRGEDRTIELPADQKPIVQAGAVDRITAHGARVSGRLHSMNLVTRFWFEYGPDENYGQRSPMIGGIVEVAPRTAFFTLSDLKPATKYHYRLVAENAHGAVAAPDAVFVTSK